MNDPPNIMEDVPLRAENQASRGFTQFVIPLLKTGMRIDEWEPLFRAATTSLLVQENGESLVIGLLPAYINRRPAEVEIVKEAIRKTTIDESFELLRTLDDPIDKYAMMQSLCKADWTPGTAIDDFFYQLRQKAKHAGAGLDLVLSIVIGQLPKRIQTSAKNEYIIEKGTDPVISEDGARKTIVKIKESLSERGIALDLGYRQLDKTMARISNVNVEAHEDSTDRLAAVSHSSYQGRTQRSNYTRNRGGYNRGGNSYRTRASNGQTCFVCNRHGHYARNCTDQFCQKCGTKGHAMRDCVEQISAITEKETSRSVPEETVVIHVSIENIICDAMIDSGAALSVIN